MIVTESWVPVVGYEGLYEVSDLGRVRSLRVKGYGHTKSPDGIMAQFVGKDGYPFVRMTKSRKRTTFNVHRLVMTAFVGPRPEGQQTRHLNGDHMDSRLVNLAYGTPSENVQDSILHGTHKETSKTHCPQGHPYNEENTGMTNQGFRYCRACSRRRNHIAYNNRKKIKK